jgi:hypothetical protein
MNPTDIGDDVPELVERKPQDRQRRTLVLPDWNSVVTALQAERGGEADQIWLRGPRSFEPWHGEFSSKRRDAAS